MSHTTLYRLRSQWKRARRTMKQGRYLEERLKAQGRGAAERGKVRVESGTQFYLVR